MPPLSPSIPRSAQTSSPSPMNAPRNIRETGGVLSSPAKPFLVIVMSVHAPISNKRSAFPRSLPPIKWIKVRNCLENYINTTINSIEHCSRYWQMLYLKSGAILLISFLRKRRRLLAFFHNYSDVILVPPAAAGKDKGKEARTPRAPARGLRTPALPESVSHLVDLCNALLFLV